MRGLAATQVIQLGASGSRLDIQSINEKNHVVQSGRCRETQKAIWRKVPGIQPQLGSKEINDSRDIYYRSWAVWWLHPAPFRSELPCPRLECWSQPFRKRRIRNWGLLWKRDHGWVSCETMELKGENYHDIAEMSMNWTKRINWQVFSPNSCDMGDLEPSGMHRCRIPGRHHRKTLSITNGTSMFTSYEHQGKVYVKSHLYRPCISAFELLMRVSIVLLRFPSLPAGLW